MELWLSVLPNGDLGMSISRAAFQNPTPAYGLWPVPVLAPSGRTSNRTALPMLEAKRLCQASRA